MGGVLIGASNKPRAKVLLCWLLAHLIQCSLPMHSSTSLAPCEDPRAWSRHVVYDAQVRVVILPGCDGVRNQGNN
jgi:hypothetical protein